jgi:hypothetical protein
MRETWPDAAIDSVLRTLVPERYWRSSLAQEYFQQQAEAIRRDSIDPELLVTVVNWHRTEISDAAGIDGYVTYPLVEKADFELGLDSVLPLQITELNQMPRVAQTFYFLPARATGVAFHGNLMEKFTEILDAAGGEFQPLERFYEISIKFMAMANLGPQITLTNQRQWQLYMAVDSLVHDSAAEAGAVERARAVHEYIRSQEYVSRIDTLPQAVALMDYLNVRHPNWGKVTNEFRVVKSTPSLRQGVYRAQIDFLDAATLQVLRVVFTYSREKGFNTRVVQLHPPVRKRFET